MHAVPVSACIRVICFHQTIAGLSVCLLTAAETASSGEQGLLEGESGLLPIQQHYFESGQQKFRTIRMYSIDKV
ncbi:hypothetical protein CS542_09145 [Pedobacter sp. IW39]|nr:hypothetical protein CS542_09145 [Pedobacter sp. IW39]